jgi:hypothetical protein
MARGSLLPDRTALGRDRLNDMSDDFGTVNQRRGDRAREIEILRQQYRRHQEALQRMTEDAPTERLASEYERLLGEIDAALVKLDELEGRRGGVPRAAARPPSPMVPPPVGPTSREKPERGGSPGNDPEATRPHGDPLRPAAEPGMRPLMTSSGAVGDDDETLVDYPPEDERRSRVALIAVIGLVALGLIAWLIWRTTANRTAPEIVQATTAEAVDTQPVEPVEILTVTPPVQNYGVIRKGTRATRQFEVANTSDEPVSIQLERSACRCLYYEYAEVIPPNGRESVTVTIDGARAPAGELQESVAVRIKGDPEPVASLGVEARIQ